MFQVDAFAAEVFSGNPAAVCPLEEFLPDRILQAIASENNLSETAFFVNAGEHQRLRWFTPACEVDLCGHATLASAYVLFHELGYADDTVRFLTRSGELRVRRQNGMLALDLPTAPAQAVTPHPALVQALGREPVEVLAAKRDYLVRFESEDELMQLSPNMESLSKLDRAAVIATARGKEVDFVSRFFAPALGIPEDPVTGSAHSTLVPYWTEKLGRDTLRARQISRRGGDLLCILRKDRVELGGQCALYLRGEIEVPL